MGVGSTAASGFSGDDSGNWPRTAGRRAVNETRATTMQALGLTRSAGVFLVFRSFAIDSIIGDAESDKMVFAEK
jgi:hypothetical protein